MKRKRQPAHYDAEPIAVFAIATVIVGALIYSAAEYWSKYNATQWLIIGMGALAIVALIALYRSGRL